MIKKITVVTIIATTMLFSCNNNGTANTNTGPEKTSEGKSSDLYFDYTLDGKEMHVNEADLHGTYAQTTNSHKFSMYVGKVDGPQLLLTIPRDMTRPSTTPSGSADYNENITQGSVSLIDYPEKGYTSNSYNSTYPETTPVMPQAIVITSSEKSGEDARIITGTFNVTTYGDKSHNDPKSTDHVIAGKFKIKHTFSSTNGGKF